jgi:hypothetical protein
MNCEKLSKEEINDNLDILYHKRDFVENIKIKFGDSFDKYLLSFSTGSLYLSIIFINAAFKNPDKSPEFINILILGWTSFLISIISCLLAIFFSMRAHREQINLIDEDIEKLELEGITKNGKNKYNFWVDLFQILSLCGFIVGMILFSIFFLFNIK